MTQLPEALYHDEIRRMIRQRRRALTPEQRQRRFGQQAAANAQLSSRRDGACRRVSLL